MFALVVRAGETMIRIAKTKDFTPAPYTVLGWQVSKIEEIVAWIQKRGVAFEKYPFVQDKESGIWTAPTGSEIRARTVEIALYSATFATPRPPPTCWRLDSAA